MPQTQVTVYANPTMKASALHTIEEAVTPASMASMFNMNVRPADQCDGHVECPVLGNFTILGNSFVEQTQTTKTFLAGSIVDLTALYLNQKKLVQVSGYELYHAAIERLIDGFKDKIPAINKEAAASEALMRRRLFEMCTQHIPFKKRRSAKASMLLDALNGYGVDPREHPLRILALDIEDIRKIRDMLEQRGCENTEKIPDDYCYAVPFFGNHHTVSFLSVFKSFKNKKSYTFSVDGMKTSINGIHDIKPRNDTCFYIDPVEAAFEGSVNKKFGKQQNAVSMRTEGWQGVDGWLPDKVFYQAPKDLNGLREPALLYKYRKDLTIFIEREHQSWEDYIAKIIIEKVQSCGCMDPQSGLVMELCAGDPVIRNRIVGDLKMLGMHDAVAELNRRHPEGLLKETKKARYYRSDHGYRMEKDGEFEDLTNFTLILESNLTFLGCDELFHTGRMLLNGRVYPFVINSGDLENPKKLDKSAKQAVLISGRASHNDTPVVMNQTQLRNVLTVLRKKISELPYTEGIMELGWHYPTKTFNGPSFSVNKLNILRQPKVFHPSTQVLNHYDTSIKSPIVADQNLPEELASLISISCALTLRSFIGAIVKPVPVINSAKNRKILSEIFKGLGQKDAIRLNHNQRKNEMSGLKGYPAYGTGYTDGQIKSSALGMFILGDQGMDIRGEYSEQDLNKAAGCLREMVICTAKHAIETAGIQFDMYNSVIYEHQLMQEGCDIICRAAQLDRWPAPMTQYTNFENFLKAIPFDQVKEHFTHYFQRQVVTIRLPEDKDCSELLLDIGQLIPSAKIRDHEVEVPSVKILELLTNFYHKTPVLAQEWDEHRESQTA